MTYGLKEGEVGDLLNIADEDIANAEVVQVTSRQRFICAYDAARCLCDLALRVAGYKVSRRDTMPHIRVIQSLEHTLGPKWKKQIPYLEFCSKMRHDSLYRKPESVSEDQVKELIASVKELRSAILDWLSDRHPARVPPGYRRG